VGRGLITEASRSHSDTPHSVALAWTSDQPHKETSTWQHTTFTRDNDIPSRIGTCNFSKREATDPHLRLHSHWDEHQDIWLPKYNDNTTLHYILDY